MLRFINELVYVGAITVFLGFYSEFHYAIAFYGLASFIAIIKYEVSKEQFSKKHI